MIYNLSFHSSALKDWKKLDKDIQNQFKKILERRLVEPHVVAAKLTGSLKFCYKIKLRQSGYRLVYQVDDGRFFVVVIAVGKRNKNDVYNDAVDRVH